MTRSARAAKLAGQVHHSEPSQRASATSNQRCPGAHAPPPAYAATPAAPARTARSTPSRSAAGERYHRRADLQDRRQRCPSCRLIRPSACQDCRQAMLAVTATTHSKRRQHRTPATRARHQRSAGTAGWTYDARRRYAAAPPRNATVGQASAWTPRPSHRNELWNSSRWVTSIEDDPPARSAAPPPPPARPAGRASRPRLRIPARTPDSARAVHAAAPLRHGAGLRDRAAASSVEGRPWRFGSGPRLLQHGIDQLRADDGPELVVDRLRRLRHRRGCRPARPRRTRPAFIVTAAPPATSPPQRIVTPVQTDMACAAVPHRLLLVGRKCRRSAAC